MRVLSVFTVIIGVLFLFSMFYTEAAFGDVSDKPIVLAGTFVFNPRTHRWSAINDNGKINPLSKDIINLGWKLLNK